MNELRDPITEWEVAIKQRVVTITGTLYLLAFVMCLIAPVFGPLIKRYKRQQYVMHENYEELAEQDMRPIRIFLWSVAIITWIAIIGSNVIYYG